MKINQKKRSYCNPNELGSESESFMTEEKTAQGQGVGQAGQEQEPGFEGACNTIRVQLAKTAKVVLLLKTHPTFDGEQAYSYQHSEMKANIMLAYRHLEDARMRIGKVLQAAGDGVSILDK